MYGYSRTLPDCEWCAKQFRHRSSTARFCDRPCKTKAANQEMLRGREVYRLVFPRGKPCADLERAWERVQQRMAEWLAEDLARRESLKVPQGE